MATSPQGICKENISLYLAAFKACRRFRGMSLMEAVKETIKTILILIGLLTIQRISHNILIYER